MNFLYKLFIFVKEAADEFDYITWPTDDKHFLHEVVVIFGRLRLSYASNSHKPCTNRTAEITRAREHFLPRLAR